MSSNYAHPYRHCRSEKVVAAIRRGIAADTCLKSRMQYKVAQARTGQNIFWEVRPRRCILSSESGSRWEKGMIYVHPLFWCIQRLRFLER